MKRIKLGMHERIVAVVPETAGGPGWANATTWVHIVDGATGKWREECIQPEDRSPRLDAIWSIGAVTCANLILSVPVTKAKR